jgi:hypothetical protein
MGIILNWKMPIEWDDGTPELDVDQARLVREGEQRPAYYVRSVQEPRGWNRRSMPKLSMTNPVMVTPEGKIDGPATNAPGAPHIRNVEMPLIKRKDGAEAEWGEIVKDGTVLNLGFADGVAGSYQWPRLRPIGPSPQLVETTRAMLAAEQKAEEEAAAMEENPLFGAF